MRNQDKLYNACQKGELEQVKNLVENGVDVTISGNWPARHASLNGHLDVVKFLVENGADITADNWAVKWASENGHSEVVKYLNQVLDKKKATNGSNRLNAKEPTRFKVFLIGLLFGFIMRPYV